jgi:hypothetical protein
MCPEQAPAPQWANWRSYGHYYCSQAERKFGALNVSAGSYIIWATARLYSTGTGSNADCSLRNAAGGNGLLENVNLRASPDRKVVSALWAQTVSGTSTLTLRCEITAGDTVSVDTVAIAAIKVGTLH